jgi:hypothetical protein
MDSISMQPLEKNFGRDLRLKQKLSLFRVMVGYLGGWLKENISYNYES